MGSPPECRVSRRGVSDTSALSYREVGVDEFSDIVSQFLPRNWATLSLVILGRDLLWCLTHGRNVEKLQINCTCLVLPPPDWRPTN